MRMTWRSLMDQLSFEFRRLRAVPVVNLGFASQPVFNPLELREEELRCAERVDLLVSDFARTRRWPALDERERFFLRERIRFAYDYATIAQTIVRNPVSLARRTHILSENRRLLEWLLIDVWRESGVVNWLDPFFQLAETNPPVEEKVEIEVSE